jgi:hypothetical protein
MVYKHRQTDKQTERQTDRHRQTERPTERQTHSTNRQMHRKIQACIHPHEPAETGPPVVDNEIGIDVLRGHLVDAASG